MHINCDCAQCVEEMAVDFIQDAVITDDVSDLAAAIRPSDLTEAEYLLDKIAAAVPGWSDRVSLGRYSRMGQAKAA